MPFFHQPDRSGFVPYLGRPDVPTLGFGVCTMTEDDEGLLVSGIRASVERLSEGKAYK